MSCHKMSEEDKLIYKDFDWDKYKEEFNIYGLNKLMMVKGSKREWER